jgi:polypeptide N-acetylgalactosaminyltransferase
MMSKEGEIRRDEACLDIRAEQVFLYHCSGSKGNQRWEYDEANHRLKHVLTKKCLTISESM